jgi:hypothetical protein
MKTKRILELAGLTEAVDDKKMEALAKKATAGKRKGIVAMLANGAGLDDVLGLAKDYDTFLDVLGQAYDAGAIEALKSVATD